MWFPFKDTMMTNKASNENSYLEFTKSIIDKQN